MTGCFTKLELVLRDVSDPDWSWGTVDTSKTGSLVSYTTIWFYSSIEGVALASYAVSSESPMVLLYFSVSGLVVSSSEAVS